MSLAVLPETIAARDATLADNAALVRLAAACPMVGDITLCIDRAPDFFALNRLEGERWRVGVVEAPGGGLVGCVSVAERLSYVHGRQTPTWYLSDLKVHPDYRGLGYADALSVYVREVCREGGGDDALAFLTILGGNRSMEQRVGGPRGLPHLTRFATLRAYSIPLLHRRRATGGESVVVRPARVEDLDEMTALWARLAPGRQFAPVLSADGLARWIRTAAGLDVSSYRVARWRDGRLAGFLGLWDQATFKRTRVLGYSRRLAVVRAGFNLVAPLVGATRLPPPGEPLRYRTAVHVCVPPEAPGVLRALVLHAYQECRGRGQSFLTIGLDVRDPLSAALRGLFAQPTDVHAYVSTPAGRYAGPPLDDRPLHFEIALV